jgi:hypothetical protein
VDELLAQQIAYYRVAADIQPVSERSFLADVHRRGSRQRPVRRRAQPIV